jgi:CspA family cold shock protein
MPKGTVKWFNSKKGFGFIKKEDGTDVFVHYTGVVGEGFRTLQEGDSVEFKIEDSDKGPRAIDVKIVV